MNENVDIFIGTHKNYTFPTNPVYKIIYNGTDKLDTNLKVYYEENELLHNLFADAIRIEWIHNNIQLKDYVGLVQYRRHFNFYDNVPNIDEIFKEHDGIVPTKLPLNLYNQFCYCHGQYTLDICIDIIKDLYPTYPSTINDWKSIGFIIPHSIFILRKNDFKNMYKFCFDIMHEFVKRNNFNTMEDVYEYNKKHLSHTDQNYRLCGYLSERLCSIWYMMNLKNPKYINVIDT